MKKSCGGAVAVALLCLFVVSGCNVGGPGGYATLASGDDALGSESFRPGSDELWVFAEAPRRQAPPARHEGPGSGSMVVQDGEGRVIGVPLRHTRVRASVRAFLATVDVEQRFHNPWAAKIEAVYVFPLPEDAAVRDFVLAIGDRQIRGVVREKEEAKRIYEAARAQGHRAALLDQARPNVFSEAVANIEPGASIDVRIRYFNTLAYGRGGYEFVFPMVVGPRYNPPGWADGIGANLPGEPHGQPTTVTYAPPDTRPGADIDIGVDADLGMPLAAVESPSHSISVEREGESHTRVRLAGGATIPNRDFVLHFAVAERETRATMLTHAAADGGHLALLLHPPRDLVALPRQPLELVFVVDCSGSMSGAPLEQAKAVAEMALDRLAPSDSFQIVRFSDTASSFAAAPVAATEAEVRRGREHLRQMAVGGGTQMLSGIRAALATPHDPEKLRFIAFLTDGYIGNESEIFDELRHGLGASRVFSLGVGSSVNRFLLEGMARLGRGAVGYLLHDEQPGPAIAELWDRISRPAMTDVTIDWNGARVLDVCPSRLPDLFVGRPIALSARFEGPAPSSVRVHGRIAGQPTVLDVPLVASTTEDAAVALPALWARRRIQGLSDFAEVEGHGRDDAGVRSLALAHGLVSPFTSFVAVDASGRTIGDHGYTVPVLVPMPAGVRYETAAAEK